MSSVMVPMTTMVFSGRERATRRESETGGRLMREVKRRRRTTALKADDVRPDSVRLMVPRDGGHWRHGEVGDKRARKR